MSTINLTQSQLKDIKAFCSLNKIEDVDAFIKLCFEKGYNVEKYGLLGKTGGEQEKRVEIPVEVIKEVIKTEYVEVPVEKIIEVIKEVPVEKIIEKPVEIIKEIPVEKVVIKEVIKEVPVEKIVTIYDNSSENELLLKIQQLESDKQLFSTKTQEFEEQLRLFSTKTTEMENIFQNEKNKLLLQIQQLENKPPEIVEVEKEVIVEKPVVDEKQKLLQQTLQTLRSQLNLKDEEIKKLKEDVEYLKGEIDKPATFLRTSNLKDNLYK